MRKIIEKCHMKDYLTRILYMFMTFSFFDILLNNMLNISLNFSKVLLNLLFSIILGTITYSYKFKHTSRIAYGTVLALIGAVYAGELVYYRVFSQFVTIKDIARVGELQTMGDMVFTYLSVDLLYYFIPLMLFIMWNICLTFMKIERPDKQKKRLVQRMIIIATAVLVFTIVNESYISADLNRTYITNTTAYAADYGIVDMIMQQIKQSQKKEEIGEVDIAEFKDAFTYLPAENDFSGRYAEKNIVFITGESISPMSIDPILTPTLYQMQQESLQFSNYYGVRPSTLNSEYALLTSFFLTPEKEKMNFSSVGTLPTLFNERGYNTMGFHNYPGNVYNREERYPELGFDSFDDLYSLEIENTVDWQNFPDDTDMIEKSFEKRDFTNPFLAYYLTVSAHGPYLNRDSLEPYLEIIEDQYPDYAPKTKGYLAGGMVTDRAVALLREKLEEKEQLDNTVIVFVGDHYPYLLESEHIEKDFRMLDSLELAKVPFFIWDTTAPSYEVTTVASQVDVLPTLSNLFTLDLQYAMGVDLFSERANNTFGEWHDFRDYSFITNEGGYDAKNNELLGSMTVEKGREFTEQSINRARLNNLEYLVKNQRISE